MNYYWCYIHDLDTRTPADHDRHEKACRHFGPRAMSYTSNDYMRDHGLAVAANRIAEDGYAVIRKRDWDALVKFAKRTVSIEEDSPAWADDSELALAIVNWNKEHVEWE